MFWVVSYKTIRYNKELINDMFGVAGYLLGLLDFLGQDSHAFLHTLLVPDGDFADSLDTLLDKFGIHLVEVLPELFQNWLIVLGRHNAHQDITS